MSGFAERILGPMPAGEPARIVGLRADARGRFEAAGLPTPKREAWKYTNLAPLQKLELVPAAANDAVPAVAPLLADVAARLVFVDGRYSAALSTPPEIDGVTFAPLAEVLAEDERIAEVLGAPTDGLPLFDLNTAAMRDGYVLRLAAGTTVEKPIEIIFAGSDGPGPVACHARHLVVAGDGAAATLVERHAGGGARFANHATQAVLAPGASLSVYRLQDESAGSYHIATTLAQLAAGASYRHFTLSLGAALARNEVRVGLQGKGAGCRLGGAYLGRGRQLCDNTMVVEHEAGETTSRQVFKGVLDDRARGVFQGRITVRPDAQKIDGHQLSKALLLSDGAEIDTKPELEIFADDVKCSHGATAGDLDQDALFYLRTRGLPEAEARGLLIRAFLEDALAEIGDEAVRAAFHGRLEQALTEIAPAIEAEAAA